MRIPQDLSDARAAVEACLDEIEEFILVGEETDPLVEEESDAAKLVVMATSVLIERGRAALSTALPLLEEIHFANTDSPPHNLLGVEQNSMVAAAATLVPTILYTCLSVEPNWSTTTQRLFERRFPERWTTIRERVLALRNLLNFNHIRAHVRHEIMRTAARRADQPTHPARGLSAEARIATCLAQRPESTVREVATLTGLTKSTVQRSSAWKRFPHPRRARTRSNQEVAIENASREEGD